jgi:hypothetical protein
MVVRNRHSRSLAALAESLPLAVKHERCEHLKGGGPGLRALVARRNCSTEYVMSQENRGGRAPAHLASAGGLGCSDGRPASTAAIGDWGAERRTRVTGA